MSSENSIEDSNPQIKTNLNENQLEFFPRYYEDIESYLSICKNLIWINFPEKYLEGKVSIHIIRPDSNLKHDMLKLVPLPKRDYTIRDKEIVFKITKERLNLKLDFFGIQILEVEEDNSGDIKNDEKEQKRYSAIICIKIHDSNGEMEKLFMSQIFQKKDLNPLAQKSVVGNKGFCLVINHEDLQCNQDIHEIRKLFTEKLHYLFQSFSFTTTKKLINTIRQKLEMFEDCHEQIFVFVFCHGNHNLIQTNDGSIHFLNFIEPFLLKDSRRIYEKPKRLFIIQKKNDKNLVSNGNSREKISKHSNSKNANEKICENIPEHSNVYLASIIVPNDRFDSLNGTQCGTLYVQTLLKVIEEDPKLEITKIEKKTCEKMKELFQFSKMIIYSCLGQKVGFDTEQRENNRIWLLISLLILVLGLIFIVFFQVY